jgi:hypothetical protein
MATLRQQQIDEILNYERAMNRTILDRSINQVTVFNDERAPPTTRDIKFEAILGGLVDKLKASMAEALKAITAKQFPSVNSYNASVLLNTKDGSRAQERLAPAANSTIDKERQQQLADEELRERAREQEEAAAIEVAANLPSVPAGVPAIQAQQLVPAPLPKPGGGADGKK